MLPHVGKTTVTLRPWQCQRRRDYKKYVEQSLCSLLRQTNLKIKVLEIDSKILKTKMSLRMGIMFNPGSKAAKNYKLL